jgi:hypothetical protein
MEVASVNHHLAHQRKVKEYESAKAKAIANRSLVEDQERVIMLLFSDLPSRFKVKSLAPRDLTVLDGFYSIDLPEWVKQKQIFQGDTGKWVDTVDDVEDLPFLKYRTVIRFVDGDITTLDETMKQIVTCNGQINNAGRCMKCGRVSQSSVGMCTHVALEELSAHGGEEKHPYFDFPEKQLESLLRRTWMKAGGTYRNPELQKWIDENRFLFSSFLKPTPSTDESQEELWLFAKGMILNDNRTAKYMAEHFTLTRKQ